MTKFMTLNLWCYYDWQNRNQNILALVNSQAPDCIALQEVQTNKSFSPKPQSDFIADNCGYIYRIFAPTYARESQIDVSGERTQRTSYGLAFLSKFPIISAETYFLQQYPDHDEACSVLFVTLDVKGLQMEVCNVHFANSDKHSELHLNELMELCKSRNVQPIMLGDFNNFNLAAYKDGLLKDYTITTDKAEYMSMPKDKGTLDYMAVPSAKYGLADVLCPDDYVSDHRALLADVSF